MNVESIASFAVVTPDPDRSRALYVDAFGLPLEHAEGDDYYHSENIDGAKHFGVWPLSQAAHACFGSETWPRDHPVPQASVEFELGDESAVAAAADELGEKGYALLHGSRREPWGQTVARLLSPERDHRRVLRALAALAGANSAGTLGAGRVRNSDARPGR